MNNIPVADKSQQDVVKILRNSTGIVSLCVARPKSEIDGADFNTMTKVSIYITMYSIFEKK